MSADSPQPVYVYRAALVRVVDGDTVVATLDLGCHVAVTKTLRLVGLDTPEVVGPDKARGLASAQAARDWCAAAAVANPGTTWPLVVATTLDKDDRYGRLLGVVYAKGDPVSLNRMLLEGGWAVAYDGR